MQDDDVRLSDGERAVFDELARRFTEDRFAYNVGHSPWRSLDRRSWRIVRSWVLVVAGVGVLVTGLIVGAACLGAAGFVALVVALQRLTRRWNSARLLLWWRRQATPQEQPEHLWEP